MEINRDLFKKNLHLAAAQNEYLNYITIPPPHADDIIPVSGGMISCRINGKLIHSRNNPRMEAKKNISVINLKGKKNIFYCPADLLYSLEEILVNMSMAEKKTLMIILYYTVPELLSVLLFYRDLEFVNGVGNFFIYCRGINDFTRMPQSADTVKSTFFLGNSVLEPYDAEHINFIRNLYIAEIRETVTSEITEKYFSKKWLVNTIVNCQCIDRKYFPLSDIKDAYKDCTCIIAAAGPSLYEFISGYQHSRSDAAFTQVLIACDTALRPLLLAGIIPDFVVSTDGGFANTYDFEYSDDKPVLCADIGVHSNIPRRFSGRRTYFCSETDDNAHSLKKEIIGYFGLQEQIPLFPSGGSVLHSAVMFGVFSGFAHIALIGADLSYPFLDSHVMSSPHFSYFYSRSSRMKTIDSLDFSFLKYRIHTNTDHTIFTDTLCGTYARNLCSLIRSFPHIVFYRSADTLPLQGFMPLQAIPKTEEKASIKNTLFSEIESTDTQKKNAELGGIYSGLRVVTAQLLCAVEKKEISKIDGLSEEISRIMSKACFLKKLLGQSGNFPDGNKYLGIYAAYNEFYRIIALLEEKTIL